MISITIRDFTCNGSFECHVGSYQQIYFFFFVGQVPVHAQKETEHNNNNNSQSSLVSGIIWRPPITGTSKKIGKYDVFSEFLSYQNRDIVVSSSKNTSLFFF